MPVRQFANPALEAARGGRPNLQAKATQDPSQAHLQVMPLALNQLACGQHRAQLLGPQRLAVHRAEPAQPHQLRNAAGVLAVGFTGIALNASRTWRVSSSSTASPASRMPAYSHCDSGPASRPIRARLIPSPPNQAIRTAGWLATLASRTIRPLAS